MYPGIRLPDVGSSMLGGGVQDSPPGVLLSTNHSFGNSFRSGDDTKNILTNYIKELASM